MTLDLINGQKKVINYFVNSHFKQIDESNPVFQSHWCKNLGK